MPLLPELENRFSYILHRFHDYGAADNKFDTANFLSRRRGGFSCQVGRLIIQKTTLQHPWQLSDRL